MITEEQENHLSNVTSFLKQLKTTIIAEELAQIDLEDINIWEMYETKPKKGFKINCDFYHKNGYLITPDCDTNESEIVKKIRNLFSILNGYNIPDVSYELKTKSSIFIKVDETLEKRLIDLLLSPELKILFNYRQLNSELNSSNKNTNRKKSKL
jgi:hypothetical protein